MDKSSSVLAALDAGKLPTTQQINSLVDWLTHHVIPSTKPTGADSLSHHGRVIARDLQDVLNAYKSLLSNKNADNIVQEAIWHLTEGDITTTPEVDAKKDQALDDIKALRSALRTIITIIWNSLSSEGTSILQDFMSIARLSLADAAEVVQEQAGRAKESLRHVEQGVQEGERDTLGRDKKRLEEEKDVKVAWQHGMDTVKDAGTSVIGTAQSASATAYEKADKTSLRLQNAFYKMCDRAGSDPEYREALETMFSIFQKRLHETVDAASDPNTTLSTFVKDPTPEQHVPKALDLIRTFVERLSGMTFDPIIARIRSCANAIVRDDKLIGWFDDFFDIARKNLTQTGWARSEEGIKKRKELRVRWKTLLEKDQKWKVCVEEMKQELAKLDQGLRKDTDMIRLKEAHIQLGRDVQAGLVDSRAQATEGVQAAVEQATWFWQDLFKVYLPKLLNKMRDVPIPRTEYKDEEIEFVLENLDISSFNLLPSHIYIRNITDIDIKTSAAPSTHSRTDMGTLTHIRIQALQLTLEDVSFWYKDKTASALGPSEFTGLLGLNLPEKGIDIDLKIRLIPASVTGPKSRESLRHFNCIEDIAVNISEDVGIEVRESNHAILTTLFKPIMVMRLREALSRTLTEQFRAVVDWTDGVAFDIGKRKEVFQDTGLGGGGSVMAAIWSEIGRLRRESSGLEFGWRATGTGLVVEAQTVNKEGVTEGKSTLAMGAEPQILSGQKRGPLGTGSEPLKDKVEAVGQNMGVNVGEVMDVDIGDARDKGKQVGEEMKRRAQGLFKEGRRQVQSFKSSVDGKIQLERSRPGWESAAFDL